MDLAVVALAYGTIFVVELPDKTFIATLLLTTRYRPLLVWLGVGLAFGLQTGIAVGLGSVAGLLPEAAVSAVAMLLFAAGGVLLLREARAGSDEGSDEGSDQEPDAQGAARARDARGWRAVLASFVVLFAAEWGDLSQLLTLSLAARYDDPLSVFVGAWAALLSVSGLAVLVGRGLLRRVPPRVLHGVGSAVCFVLAVATAVELLA